MTVLKLIDSLYQLLGEGDIDLNTPVVMQTKQEDVDYFTIRDGNLLLQTDIY